MRLQQRLVAIITAVALGCSSQAMALGLGAVKLKSRLHQPLQAEIELLDVRDFSPTEILASLASEQDFVRAGILRPFSLTQLQFKTSLRGDGTGVIHISSSKPVQEPFLNFLLEVYWPRGRLLREYTFLMDLPTYSQYPAAPIQPPESQPAGVPRSGQVSSPVPVNPGTRLRSEAVDPAAPRYPVPAVAEQPLKLVDGLARYGVKASDSLWEIARKNRPGKGVSIQQTMLAIQRLNPQAFEGNNINKLKTGVVLRLPDRSRVDAITFDQALWEVARQNRQWRQPLIDARQGKPGATEVKTAPAPGRLSIVALDEPADSQERDRGQAGSGAAADGEALMRTREQLDRLSRENNELKSRLQELDEQVATLKRLMMLKDEQMAALQAARPPESAAPDAAPAQDVRAEKAINAAVTPEVSAGQTAPETAPPPRPAPEPETIPEPGFFESLPGFPLLLLPLLIALAVGYGYYRRRQAESALVDDEVLEVFELDEPNADSSDHDSADHDSTDHERIAPDVSDSLAQADAHISYGRFEQAAACLDKAIGQAPERADLQLKLLEVYAESGDVDQFRQALVRLEVLADEEALALAETFKTRFAPGVFAAAPVQSGAGAGDDRPIPDGSGKQGGEPDEQDSWAEALDDFELDLDLDLDAEPEPEPEPEPEADALEFQPSVPQQAEASGGGETEQAMSLLDDADQDLIIDFEPAPVAVEPSAGDDDLPDFDVDSLDSGVAENEHQGIDFDMTSTGDLLPSEEPVDNSAPQGEQPLSTGESVLDFEDDFDEEELDFFAEDDDVAVKLDLARAYIDMGDRDGAADILDEVLVQGTEDQQQEARQLMDQI